MVKYIVLTGGVISSLGKGITSSSLGALLTSRGIKTTIIKIDGYLNIDAGLMSPYEHGEVFVTQDGAETDLDIGHYERFLDRNLTERNNITSGKIYLSIIQKERRGEYLGKTVQVIPHVTNEIKAWIKEVSDGFDIAIIEIGGVVGDMESMPFIEAVRQISTENRKDIVFIHLALIPFLSYLGENKTKPLQNSVKTLLSCGIQPDILICRSKGELNQETKQKISNMTNVPLEFVFNSKDVVSKYVVPEMLHRQGLDSMILKKLSCFEKFPNLCIKNWLNLGEILEKEKNFKKVVIGMVRKYVCSADNYVSLVEALHHAGWNLGVKVEILYLNSEDENLVNELKKCDGILVPGGWGTRGIEGKKKSANYARVNNIPYLGLCYGFQLALLEFAKNVCKMEDPNTVEIDKNCKNPLFVKIESLYQKNVKEIQNDNVKDARDQKIHFSRILRVGERTVNLKKDTKIANIYGKTEIKERYRHRFTFDRKYQKELEDKGIIFTGTNQTDSVRETLECFELKDHKFMLGVQYHPEYLSRPFNAHPLFIGFLKASLKN